MHTPSPVTRELVIEQSLRMPSFPRVITDILSTIEDPDANLHVLANHINHDPLIAARVLSAANAANARLKREQVVADIHTATALIGMSRVREIALIGSLGAFVRDLNTDPRFNNLWHHCVATGVCCEELALYIEQPVSVDAALIAGLLHDIGQLWFYAWAPEVYRDCRERAMLDSMEISAVEQSVFGTDHAQVGFWLAQNWSLPEGICQAILGHHAPEDYPDDTLTALLHVAEVLSNALDLTHSRDSRVTHISAAACKRLGLVWDKEIHTVFGRIEARSQHATSFFTQDGH